MVFFKNILKNSDMKTYGEKKEREREKKKQISVGGIRHILKWGKWVLFFVSRVGGLGSLSVRETRGPQGARKKKYS